MKEIREHSLCIVKETYFSDFASPYWMDNKQEGRPYYFFWTDADGIDWMIPISSQVENYSRKIQREETKRGPGNCVYYHIGEIAGQKRAFLIGDMFPIDEAYISRTYTIAGVPYVVKDKRLISALHSKAMRYLNLVKDGKMKSRNDIMGIKRVLLNRRDNQEYLV